MPEGAKLDTRQLQSFRPVTLSIRVKILTLVRILLAMFPFKRKGRCMWFVMILVMVSVVDTNSFEARTRKFIE